MSLQNPVCQLCGQTIRGQVCQESISGLHLPYSCAANETGSASVAITEKHTDDEINVMAREIADEAAWDTIRSFCWTFSKVSQGKGLDIGNCEHGNEDIVVQAARYLDARGLLERPDPAKPNIVRRKKQHGT